jgi:hypothetical protein
VVRSKVPPGSPIRNPLVGDTGRMGFRRRTNDQLAQLRAELDGLRALEQERRAAAEVATRAQSEVATAEASTATPDTDTPAAPAFEPPAPGSSLDDVRAALEALSERVDGLDVRHTTDRERVQARLDEITVLLTNQLTELSSELEAGHASLRTQLDAQSARVEELASEAARLAEATPSPADDERVIALLEELRSNQVRIANDLARHEISVRQDVATLAELVKRPPAR